MFFSHQAPTPYASLLIPVRGRQSTGSAPSRVIPAKGLAALAAKRNHWATLSLRQDWADESFMRSHLKAAGVLVRYRTEPANASRLKSLLRKAGVSQTEAEASVGQSLSDYLTSNPLLPLWAAVALVLEATGRFTGECAEDAAFAVG